MRGLLPGLLNCELRNVGISQKGGHDHVFSGIHIILEYT